MLGGIMAIAPLMSGLRILGVILVVQALMLLGADEITTIERGWIRTIRPFGEILTLYHATPASWMAAMPAWLAAPFTLVLAAPGWGVSV
jgi:hypothetical protein